MARCKTTIFPRCLFFTNRTRAYLAGARQTEIEGVEVFLAFSTLLVYRFRKRIASGQSPAGRRRRAQSRSCADRSVLPLRRPVAPDSIPVWANTARRDREIQ